jgi:hypothetical protein
MYRARSVGPRSARLVGSIVVLAATWMITATRPAGASGASSRPEPIAPAPGAVVDESALRFAWVKVSGTSRHYLLLSRAPFETGGWSMLPRDPAIQVRALARPVAALDELGIEPVADAPLWWAAADQDPASGHVWFSAARSVSVIPRFTHPMAASPLLEASRTTAAAPATDASFDRIRLAVGYEIDPRRGEPPLPEALRDVEVSGDAPRAVLVWFGDADPERTRRRILESGGTVVAYVPDHAFLVRLPASRALALESAPAWIGEYHPAYKVSLGLDVAGGPRAVQMLLFPGGDLDAAIAEIEARGGAVTASSANGINTVIRASVDGPAIAALARHPDVMWIEPWTPFETNNDSDQWVLQTNENGNRRIWDKGLHGEGQVIMTSDTGIEPGHDMFRDNGLSIVGFGDYPTHRKLIAYRRGGNSSQIVFGDHGSYHGTHTAGTAAGQDDLVGGASLRDGIAKAARLYFMDCSGSSMGGFLDIFPDLNDLFQPSYTGNAGGAARISSNSWGSPVNGAYDIAATMADQFMWSHPDYLICFANGNSGVPGSVVSPASAKSVVSVGGTGNAASASSIYSGTSRGPAADGRRKPTLCAPAILVSSTAPPSTYSGLAGTSMASPGAAGTAALMRQYLVDGWYPTGAKVAANGFSPSAALLKAMLINSGNDDVSGFHAPDLSVGYGRILADSVLYFAGDQRGLLLADMTAGLGHGRSIEYQVNVVHGMPLEVSLCWTDYPGAPFAGRELVNDLDLTVTNGDSTYRGNSYTSGWSNRAPIRDSLNVEEAVRIANPPAGLWTIRIEGRNVPFGPQPFGLCVTGGLGPASGALALDRSSYGSTSTVHVRLTDTNAPLSVTVRISSPTEPSGETLKLAALGGAYAGALPLSPFLGASGDGTLQVSNGDLITAVYQDASPSLAIAATARISIEAPAIDGVHASSLGQDAALVEWTTDRNASSRVLYGSTLALGLSTTLDPTAVLRHAVVMPGLGPGQTIFYDVESTDLEGNATRDDNGGAHYRVTVQPPSDLLLVYSGAFERPDRYANALAALGWSFDVWSGPAAETPWLGNASAGLRSYRAVWWQVGLEQVPPFSDLARDSLTAYLLGGGRLAVVGHDIAFAFGDPGSAWYSSARNGWLQGTLRSRLLADASPSGWGGLRGIPGDPISSGLDVSYAQHRDGASGDRVATVPSSGTAFIDWVTAGSFTDSCGVRWESSGPLGVPGASLWAGQPSRLSAMYFEWSGIDPHAATSPVRDTVLAGTLDWLIGRSRPIVALTAPNGGATFTGDAIEVAWTENGDRPIASRTLEYSLDGGDSWATIATGVGPSPYSWNVTGIPNTIRGRARVRITDDGSPNLSRMDASDASFAIQRAAADATGPVVVAGTVRVSPNPIVAGASAMLSAVFSDSTSGGSPVAAAEWSSGDQPAAAGAGIAMTGPFGAIEAAASASIPAGTFPAGVRHLHVRGRDAAGQWGAARTLAVVVNDPTTPALLAMFQSEAVDDGIEVRWTFAPGVLFESIELERAERSEGPWSSVGGERRRDGEGSVILDRDVPAGARVWYRLTARPATGAPVVFGPIAAVSGAAPPELVLLAVRPNPSTGLMRIQFAVPHEARLALSVVDIQGREVARLADGVHRPGRYEASWTGEDARGPAPAGVYFIVLRAAGKDDVRRVVVAR